MLDSARVEFGIEIGLIDQIFSLGKLAIGRQGYCRLRGIDRTRKYILVEFVIVGIPGAVPYAHLVTEIMFNQQGCCIGVRSSRAVAGVSEKLASRGPQRSNDSAIYARAKLCGNTAIGDAIILKMFKARMYNRINAEL